ncbi:GMC oxidoreductase, partial [bacterium]|nr:GMC oxidoreductase [bacterium]
GFVEIKSNNYLDNPKIQFNYLENEEDLQQMRDSVKIANKIFKQNSMKKYLGDQIRPGFNITNDELDNIIRETADTAYHPSCTNKMGVDKMSVVDQETKVYGVENLRVIDSSIMPDILSGNLNAGTIMIAEKAADMIKGNQEDPVDAKFYN